MGLLFGSRHVPVVFRAQSIDMLLRRAFTPVAGVILNPRKEGDDAGAKLLLKKRARVIRVTIQHHSRTQIPSNGKAGSIKVRLTWSERGQRQRAWFETEAAVSNVREPGLKPLILRLMKQAHY